MSVYRFVLALDRIERRWGSDCLYTMTRCSAGDIYIFMHLINTCLIPVIPR